MYWVFRRISFFFIAIFILADIAGAQPVVYTADGFEPPKFVSGKLAGSNMFNGQNGWLATADLGHTVNLNGIVVQKNIVKDGAQAGEWDASQMDFNYAHLRTNTVFNPKASDKVEILLDIYLKEDINRSNAWGLDVYGGPAIRLTWWTIRSGDNLFVMDPLVTNWVDTGFTIKRDTWYKTRTVIDFKNMTSTLYINNLPIYTTDVIDKFLAFGFASIFLDDPGEDKMYFDNFVVQYYSVIGLASDSSTLSEKGGKVNFFLDATAGNANQNYILLTSATGTSPGIPLPGGAILPINWDLVTSLNASMLNTPLFNSFLGTLDASGKANAMLEIKGALGPGAVGLKLFFAYALDKGAVFASSNAVTITIVK